MKIICIEFWIVFTQPIKYWQSSHMSYRQFPIVDRSFKHIICTLSLVIDTLSENDISTKTQFVFRPNKYIYRVNLL